MKTKNNVGIENIDYVTKQSKNNGELIIKEIDYQIAKEMTIANHYSHTWNTSFGKINYGIYRDGELLGCAVYGNLMNPKSVKSITDDGDIIELNRLWVDDILGKNTETMFLSATFTLIKNNYPEIVLVQSFADGRLGVGTIYKASNFGYYGKTTSRFFDNGESVFHKVPLENTKRPKGFMIKNLYVITNNVDVFDVNTYRYLYKLKKKVNIKLKQQPYPEYQKGQIQVTHIPSIGTYTRLALMYKMFKLDKEYAKTLNYLLGYYSKDEISTEWAVQKKNKSLIDIYKNYKEKEILAKEVRKISKQLKI